MPGIIREFIDKALHGIDADHYFTTPGARDAQADIITDWIGKRWP